MGSLGLATVLADELAAAPKSAASIANPLAAKAPHFAPRAKRIIHLYMTVDHRNLTRSTTNPNWPNKKANARRSLKT
jgi:hypothetical protein